MKWESIILQRVKPWVRAQMEEIEVSSISQPISKLFQLRTSKVSTKLANNVLYFSAPY